MKRSLVVVVFLVWCFTPLGQGQVLADSTDWQSVPGPTGGSVTALVMSPNYAIDHTVFAGLRGRGVYRSVDGGGAWQPLGLLDQAVIDLAISPNFAVDHTLFAAVGLGPGSYTVYRSVDDGATWLPPYLTPYADGFKTLVGLSISPNYSADYTVYALGATEMYKSTDGGLAFVKMGGWYATHHVTALVFSPGFVTDHTVFAAVQGGGILKSLDSGGTWAATSFDSNFTFMALAISPNYLNDLTVAAIDGYTGQLYISTDGGATRTERSLFLGLGDKHTLFFSPTFAADRLMLAASSGDPGAYRSIDGGEMWTPVGWYDPAPPFRVGFVGGSILALAIPPGTVENGLTLAGTSSGLYLSRDRGQTWDQNNTGLPYLTLRSFALAPNNPATVLAGTSYFGPQHFTAVTPIEADGNLQLSSDGGRTWRDVSGRLDRVKRVVFSPDFANDHTALACAGVVGQDGDTGGGVYRSIDDAKHWSALINHSACNDLALAPNYAADRTAWVSGPGQGLLRTTNGGDTWDVLNNAFVADTLMSSSNYAADHTLFASTSDGRLQKSIDGGEHWTPILNHPITALAISPAFGASQTIYAGVKETSNSSGDLYRSSDGGTNWQKLDTGIPSIWNSQQSTINTIDFAPDGSIAAGITYGGESNGAVVYRSIDGGQTWQPVGGGLSEGGLFALTSLSSAGESDQRGAFAFLAGTAHAIEWLTQQQRDLTEPGVWDTHGPRGGRADVLVISPNFVTDGVAFSGEWNWFRFSGQYGRGIAKSTDWGQTWQASNDTQQAVPNSSTAVRGFAFSPNFASDHTVFFASWSGLFKSIDGGASWQPLSGFEPGVFHAFNGISVAPNYPTSGHMLAQGGYYGGCLYRSIDFGMHWSYGCDEFASTVAYSPNFANDNTIFIAANGVRQSVDGGLTWRSILTGTIGGVVVSPQYAADRTLFASGDALYKSTDCGTTWMSVTVGISATSIGLPAISPAFATDRTLFVTAGNQLYRSGDGGLTWDLVPAAPNLALGPIAISPGWPVHPYLLIGTAQGVHRSIDGGTTWARMQGLTPLATTPIAFSADEALWLSGTTNGLHASTDAGHSWFPLGLQDYRNNISRLAISPGFSSDQTIFAVLPCPDCIGTSVYRTTDSGTTWNRIYGGGQAIGSLAISPQYASDHTIFAGTYDHSVVGSMDGGDTWQPIGTWPPGISFYKYYVALSPNYPTDRTIFAANSGFWRLPPGETVWQPAASGLLSTTNVTAFAVAPNYTQSHTLLAATVEYEMDGVHSSVFRSEDGGVNWQLSDIGLPDGDLHSLAFSSQYGDDHTVYLVSPQQLYRSIDDGHSWIAVGAPPDDVWLNKVTVSRAGEVLLTSSAGVWRYSTGFRDVLINGDAEAGSGWSFSSDGAGYATEISYHAQHGLRLGLANGSNRPIDSFATQTVTIPISATVAQLNLRLYPVSSEASLAPHRQAITPGDAQYVRLTLSGTHVISATLLWTLSNAQAWQRTSFDLTPYAGQTIGLRLGVINDGQGGQTALYVDNASLITLGPGGSRVYLPVILKNHLN